MAREKDSRRDRAGKWRLVEGVVSTIRAEIDTLEHFN